MRQLTASEASKTCEWDCESSDEHWVGSCGNEWVFTSGGPAENKFFFCCRCGKPVEVDGVVLLTGSKS